MEVKLSKLNFSGKHNFKKVHNIKYLAVDINEMENRYKEINRKITTGSECYFLTDIIV